MAAELPDWFDVNFVRTAVTALIIVAIVGAIVILVRVRDLTHRLVALGVVALIVVGLAWYRAELNECEETCSCKFVFDTLACDGK